MSKIEKLAEEIKGLSVLEAVELAKKIKEDLNLPDAAPVMMMAGGAAGGAGAAEEKDEVTVELTEVPADKKIAVLKQIREILGLGLADAKAFVESTPKVVKEEVAKNEAEELKKKLEEAGAKVTLK
ncbi:MAG: 50S ribosomal protein L7/L12 [Alphaproteobacteria bacterium]|nr:MAG: 50S ribosomal protein L7/L12 [Alphaproteobacteria bacterium]